MGVEPTTRPARGRIAGFEGRESHRTLFASEMDYRGRAGLHSTLAARAGDFLPREFDKFRVATNFGVDVSAPADLIVERARWL